ncbi:MAG: nuclear transport factor 2 family protein [Phycisphaerae bacterium]|nr:nuclear transport factor 2 family protein [Phycisphaerae bacterium]
MGCACKGATACAKAAEPDRGQQLASPKMHQGTRRTPSIILPASLAAAICAVGFAGHARLSVRPQDAAPASTPPIVAPAPAWPTDDAGLQTLATKVISNWFDALSRGDGAAIEAQLLPCAQLVAFDGVTDRALSVARVKDSATHGVQVSNVVATRVGDALVTTCLVRAQQKVGGADLSGEAPRIGVWVPFDGGWKIAAWASLQQPSPRPAPAAPTFAGETALAAEGSAMLTRFLDAQRAKDLKPFEKMLAPGLQVVNFKGQKTRADLMQGASHATTEPAKLNDVRTTRCGELTIVTCNLSMQQKIGFTTLPADPAPFLAVFSGTGDAATVIALGNTNRPK